MTRFPEETDQQGQALLIRLGGLAIIIGLALHIVLNAVLKQFPPEDPSAAELQAYLARESGAWAIVHGFRYVAFACIVLFAAGLFSRTRSSRFAANKGWGVVGLLGAAIFVTNGIITNGIEILAFINTPLLAENQDLFWLLFELTRVLFTAEVVTWSFMILGFSMAGILSATIPKWIAILGLLQVIFGLASGVFIISVLSEGWATILIEVASISGLVWFLSVGVYMVIRGDARQN